MNSSKNCFEFESLYLPFFIANNNSCDTARYSILLIDESIIKIVRLFLYKSVGALKMDVYTNIVKSSVENIIASNRIEKIIESLTEI